MTEILQKKTCSAVTCVTLGFLVCVVDSMGCELDGMISFTGLITFRKTEAVQAVAAWCPADRFMLETDSPFLSPEPMRGQLNIPGRTRYVAEKVAALRGCTLEEIAELTTANARRFFRLSC